MDRDTVRLVVLLVGVLVIAGIYVWGRWGSVLRDFVQRRGAFDELALDEPLEAAEGGALAGSEFDDAEYVDGVRPLPQGSARSSAGVRDQVMQEQSRAPREALVGAPFLIQVSVVARPGDTFSGTELRDAFLDLGLVHGEMEIFHRYDRNFREPLFSVASLVRPGTFPIDEMAEFSCPGVVMFFQPSKVTDPLAVFDDLFETSRDLAEKLDGEEWDESRRPLTEEKIRDLRDRLEDVCR
jgi:cell division protein ZipA